MFDDVVPCMITCNAGSDIEGSTIKWTIRNQFSKFKRAIIVDGNLTDEAKEYYKQYPNLNVVDSPWDDVYVKQYRAWKDRLKQDEWAIHLDDDESLSPVLLEYLLTHNFKEDENNLYMIPCVLQLTEDRKKYYPAEKPPEKIYDGQWTKSILVKNTMYLNFRYFGAHCIPIQSSNEKRSYLPYAYLHNKSLKSFVWNDLLQSFLLPEGQMFSKEDASRYRLYTSKYKTTKEFKKATIDGTWTAPLQKFAWEKRHVYNNPVSRLAWTYYILCGHAMPEVDNLMTWDNVKQYIQSPENMAIYEQNKKLEQYTEIN